MYYIFKQKNKSGGRMIRLRALRQEQNISMKQLGDIFDVAESTISLYENEKRKIDTDMLIKFANYFNVSTDYFLGITDERNPSLDNKDIGFDDYIYAIHDETKGLTDSDKQILLGMVRMLKKQVEENPKKITRNKGKNLLKFPNDYVVIDIETTGLSSQSDYIIELSALKINSGTVTDEFSTLIKPDDMSCEDADGNCCYINSFITGLTGITNEMLEEAPYLDVVLPAFLDFIGDNIIVGQNVNFDINFLYDEIKRILDIELHNDFCDLLRISRLLLPELRDHKLGSIAKYFEITPDGQHRAADDCVTTFKCFEACRVYFRKYGLPSTDVHISSKKEIYKSRRVDFKKIQPQCKVFDKSNPLYGKYIVFTGKLEAFTREDAAQIVVNYGGALQSSITKKTNFLIMGDNSDCKFIKDGKSSKQKKAEELIASGQDLKILSEDEFCDIIRGMFNEQE